MVLTQEAPFIGSASALDSTAQNVMDQLVTALKTCSVSAPEAAQIAAWEAEMAARNAAVAAHVTHHVTRVHHVCPGDPVELDDVSLRVRATDDRVYRTILGLTEAQPRGLSLLRRRGHLLRVVRGAPRGFWAPQATPRGRKCCVDAPLKGCRSSGIATT